MPSFVLFCYPGNSRGIIAAAGLVSKFSLLALKTNYLRRVAFTPSKSLQIFVSASCDLRVCIVWLDWTQSKFFFGLGLPNESLVWFDILVPPLPGNLPLSHLLLHRQGEETS